MDLKKLFDAVSLLKEFESLRVNQETKQSKNEGKEFLGKHICILQRGWVFVGDLSKVGDDCFLDNAAVIRIWGTTRGLGEIAENGPIKDKTILDPCPQVRFHYGTMVASIQCRAEKW